MRVSREDIYRELAKLAKKKKSRLVYRKNHARWHLQGRKVWA
jgi:hypothetical protein